MFWSRSVTSSDRARTPRGRRAYAIGDIHGRLDLLREILDSIASDDHGRPPARTSIIFLGDLIDRGPNSAQVVEYLRLYRPEFAKPLYLMGNHEEVLLRILAGEDGLLGQWLGFGGSECAASYGVDPAELRNVQGEEAIERLRSAVPEVHVRFLKSFVDSVSFGSYLFVHAGIRPGIPLAEQSERDLRWIRKPFLDDDRQHGALVVHGHTITERAEFRSNRIGIDTGAWMSGRLSALGLEGSDQWLLQTGEAPLDPGGARVAKPMEAH